MRRGFLNSKKVKDQPLYDKGKLAVTTPPKDLEPASDTAAISRPKALSEPVVGTMVLPRGTVTGNSYLEPYSLVRIPSLAFTKSKEPSSACIIRASACTTIMNTPGYYTPPPAVNPANVVSTKTTPDMGVGLFAKRNIKIHQVIFSERPLLVFPSGMFYDASKNPSKEEVTKKSDLEFEKTLQKALSIMTKEDIDAYMRLSNCIPNCPPIYGIARTNSFAASSIEEQNVEDGKFGYGAVGRLASRINHCCTQNIWVDFDIPTFSLQVIALRDIKAGEQLFHCYCQENRSVKERRRQLATYGFECQCKACVNATPESDKLREEMDDRLQKIIEGKDEMFANPQFNVRSLDPLLKFEKDIVKEGLDFKPKFVNLLSIIMEAYREFKNTAKTREYFTKMNRYRG